MTTDKIAAAIEAEITMAGPEEWILIPSDPIRTLLTERKAMREALEVIAGKRQCLDNLMSNSDVARAALQEKTS